MMRHRDYFEASWQYFASLLFSAFQTCGTDAGVEIQSLLSMTKKIENAIVRANQIENNVDLVAMAVSSSNQDYS